MCIFLSKVCISRGSSVPRLQAPVPREAENAHPLFLQYLIITAEAAPGSCSCYLLWAPSAVEKHTVPCIL